MGGALTSPPTENVLQGFRRGHSRQATPGTEAHAVCQKLQQLRVGAAQVAMDSCWGRVEMASCTHLSPRVSGGSKRMSERMSVWRERAEPGPLTACGPLLELDAPGWRTSLVLPSSREPPGSLGTSLSHSPATHGLFT